ncbi:hypothetical protein QBC38DRAFT_50127 [Podospora fimiseda]|uniref:Uncharacterized protein n=1 Tax=Podospora fimiseda TaxID=252190 RepID=A0AAN7H2M1_9PEZI|nr:hypothetical protein QBC38DRAFT_50127 [Podospora fimiseda]
MAAPYSSIDSAVPRPSPGVSTPQRMPSTRSRAQSISSDRPSTVAHSLMSPPLQVSPEPAFIAASAASQIVTNDYDNHTETWYDQHGIEPSGETTTVSPGALQLVNSFLDQLLFNFLCVSRSTSLAALRPAVSEVLKPKLAKDAITQADEELREYLGGDDGDQSSPDPVSPADWDVELVWKRARLRTMVYSSLGDMEEEDEDFYTEEGLLNTGLGERVSEAVSPAVAIFLTSILEFIGEQALIVAGQAAYHRMRAKYEKELKDGIRSPTSVADKIVVEELDMERVALDRTLGRLWRSWKKKIRSPGASNMERLIRSFSDNSMRSPGHLRSSSSAAELMVPASIPEPLTEEQTPAQDVLEEYLIAASIPLPLRENDVDEIEVPGLAPEINDDEDGEKVEVQREAKPARRKSMIEWPLSGPHGLLTSDQVQPQPSVTPARKRSNSVPTPTAAPFEIPFDEPVADSTDESPSEESPSSSGETATETTTVTKREPTPEIVIKIRPLSYIKGEDDEDDEVLIEEPRIVRSSRVSILGGRGPSPTLSEHGRPAAINTSLPARPPSIHSARLIEVSSPRSPVVGSQRSSLIASSESSRHASPSRASGSASPTIPEERRRPSPDHVSGSRLSVVRVPRSGLANGESISDENEEDNDYAVSPITPLTPASTGTSLAVIPESGSAEQATRSVDHGYGSDAGSATERASTPQSVKPTAKVAVLASTASSSPSRPSTAASGTFFIESMPVLAEEGSDAVQEKQWPQPQPARSTPPPSQLSQPPAVPERSAERSGTARQAVANTSAQRQPATIGQVSVERPRNGSPSGSYSTRPVETGRTSRSSGSPGSSKVKPVKTSEDGGMQARIDVVRNFEELIQSDQTIQYTLTPESMRDTGSQSSRKGSSGSPVISVKHRKSEDIRHGGPHSRSSSLARPNEIIAGQRPKGHYSSSSDAHSSLRSYPTNTSKHGGFIPRSSPPAPSRPRGNAPQARDARLPRESIAEFADFIRSTGPPGAVAPAPSIASGGGSGSIRNPGMMSMTSIVSQGSLSSNPNRPKLQARDAVVDHKDGNSDLIDFIRRGPPDNQAGHRIPRAVAPFRTTMDSDQMAAAVGGKAIDAQINEAEIRSSQASSNSVHPSVQSSVNSHSALINKNKPTPTSARRGGDDIFGGPPGDMDMPMPKRKTRRVRDPYAIDLSDEDEMLEEELMAAVAPKPKRKVQQEESLIDFLNNYPPPPEEPVQPIYNVQVQSSGRNKPKKKSSSASLMARLTRRESSQNISHSGGPPPSSSSGTAGFMGFNSGANKHQPIESSAGRGLSSRASSTATGGGGPKYTPIQVSTVALNPNMSGGGNPPPPSMMSGKAAAMMGGGGGGGGPLGSRPPTGASGRVPMKKYEPRDAVLVPNRGTNDLAEFLKHSAPPPGLSLAAPFPEPMGPIGGRGGGGNGGKEGSSGLGKVFGRRKKQSVG